MWGHAFECPCGICRTFYRIFQLIRLGSHSVEFQESALRGTRLLESELRDELGRRGISDSPFELPFLRPGAATPAGEPAQGLAAGATSAKAQGPVTGSGLAASTPKDAVPVVSAPPPAESREDKTPGKPIEVKEELKSPEKEKSKIDASGALPVEPGKESPKGEKPTPISDSEVRPSAPSSSSRRSPEKRPRGRSRSRRRRRRRETSSPSDKEGGKERKKKSEPVPEPANSPPPHVRRRFPAPPDYPPPGLRKLPPRPGPGSRWVGPVPYSNHPRWSGQNKGITKRAKQELRDRSSGHR